MEELDTAKALDLVDQLAELGVSAVSLTGGEPFLRSDWELIAKRVRDRGMILRFAANGHFLREEVVEKLVALQTEALAVSVDGLRDTHDEMRHGPRTHRGGSSFERVMKALDRLARTSISPHVITSVTRRNLPELPQVHEILKERGVRHWIVQLAHRTGRLAKVNDSNDIAAPIRPADLPELAAFIVSNSEDPVLQPAAFNSVGYLSREEPIIRASGRRAKYPIWRGCQCGISSVGIEPDGGIKGCANQVGSPFVVGNVREEPLRKIWEDRSRWHWLSPGPEKMTGECARCALAKVCHAGCTTLALSTTGELFNNPYCLRALEREAKKDQR